MMRQIVKPTDGSPDSGKPISMPNRADRRPALTDLEAVAARLVGALIDGQIDAGDPRPHVERASRDADPVILFTHGRDDMNRLSYRSVAARVLRVIDAPSLPVHDETRASGEE
jgi:nucleotide-binding universal stress UspA family protein